ncbi:hypothetical protein [Nakamurella sp. PAMC28650]|uniref:hypothetical protein n=1 Tax=Nakamurella sp. PAMC28650 TaxID=2762325 RepID=UPI0021069491|nr:hypothetical protein [Nakamurella sp. PAMC28650]
MTQPPPAAPGFQPPTRAEWLSRTGIALIIIGFLGPVIAASVAANSSNTGPAIFVSIAGIIAGPILLGGIVLCGMATMMRPEPRNPTDQRASRA